MSCFANSTTCPALLAPRRAILFLPRSILFRISVTVGLAAQSAHQTDVLADPVVAF
jgi:hypothetical protein